MPIRAAVATALCFVLTTVAVGGCGAETEAVAARAVITRGCGASPTPVAPPADEPPAPAAPPVDVPAAGGSCR